MCATNVIRKIDINSVVVNLPPYLNETIAPITKNNNSATPIIRIFSLLYFHFSMVLISRLEI